MKLITSITIHFNKILSEYFNLWSIPYSNLFSLKIIFILKKAAQDITIAQMFLLIFLLFPVLNLSIKLNQNAFVNIFLSIFFIKKFIVQKK